MRKKKISTFVLFISFVFLSLYGITCSYLPPSITPASRSWVTGNVKTEVQTQLDTYKQETLSDIQKIQELLTELQKRQTTLELDVKEQKKANVTVQENITKAIESMNLTNEEVERLKTALTNLERIVNQFSIETIKYVRDALDFYLKSKQR
ncbi:MAG: hypothetical protein ACE5QV_09165 [Fidelibacterota bacterium]